MPVGVVQFFLSEKGYGYIRVPESREEYYVHRKQLLQPVERGMKVRFVVRENKQGAFAAQVKAIEKDE